MTRSTVNNSNKERGVDTARPEYAVLPARSFSSQIKVIIHVLENLKCNIKNFCLVNAIGVQRMLLTLSES